MALTALLLTCSTLLLDDEKEFTISNIWLLSLRSSVKQTYNLGQESCIYRVEFSNCTRLGTGWIKRSPLRRCSRLHDPWWKPFWARSQVGVGEFLIEVTFSLQVYDFVTNLLISVKIILVVLPHLKCSIIQILRSGVGLTENLAKDGAENWKELR